MLKTSMSSFGCVLALMSLVGCDGMNEKKVSSQPDAAVRPQEQAVQIEKKVSSQPDAAVRPQEQAVQSETPEHAKTRLLNEFMSFVEESGAPVPLQPLRAQLDASLSQFIKANEESKNMTDKQLIAMMKKILDDAKTNIIASQLSL